MTSWAVHLLKCDEGFQVLSSARSLEWLIL